jgi:hypothetical protein
MFALDPYAHKANLAQNFDLWAALARPCEENENGGYVSAIGRSP